MMKTIWLSLSEMAILGPSEPSMKMRNFLCIHTLRKYKENIPRFGVTIFHLKYEFGTIIHSEVIGQELDYDPSEGQDWNWEDYE